MKKVLVTNTQSQSYKCFYNFYMIYKRFTNLQLHWCRMHRDMRETTQCL
jgi:hypothetical protein